MNTEEINQLKNLREKSICLNQEIIKLNQRKKAIVTDWIKTNKRIAELRKKVEK
jgi:hypothetical protein